MVKIKIRPSALKSEELQRAAEIATIAQFTGLLVSTPTFPLRNTKMYKRLVNWPREERTEHPICSTDVPCETLWHEPNPLPL